MQFVLLIYQGTTPTPTSEAWRAFSEDEKKEIYTEYNEINNSPGITLGLPLGLPKDATTVRVQDGKTLTTKGSFLDPRGCVGGYYSLEAENLDAAINLASRIPAARLGGAIEVRPVAKYW
jgi:hypothetical protein